jgi:hypothetical protein
MAQASMSVCIATTTEVGGVTMRATAMMWLSGVVETIAE